MKAPEPFIESMKGEDKKDSLALNPKFASWFMKDQQVLSFLLMSCSKEILGQIPTMIKSTKEAWTIIERMFASQSRAHVINMRMALVMVSKGASSIGEYFVKMKGLADDMASTGHKLEDKELVSYIMTGLDDYFDPVVSIVAARVEPILVSEL